MTIILNYIAPLLFGACIGSFLNVVVYRLPLNRSVITPGSHCSSCGKPLPWYHNIPIFSWFWLRGRAACCGTRIDARYPLVEAITAGLTLATWLMFPPHLAICYLIFIYALIVGTFVDLDHFIIPDTVSLGGCVYGVLACLLVPELQDTFSRWDAFKSSILGLVIGGGGLLVISIVGALVFQKDAMGLGDVKLLAAIGALLGWKAVLFTIIAASFIGSFIGLAVIIQRKQKSGIPIPFGPFLSGGCIVYIFKGEDWINAYFRTLGIYF